jgi:hypothetical protein
VTGAPARDQRDLVQRDIVWATRSGGAFGVLAGAVGTGHVIGSLGRGGEPSYVVLWQCIVAALLALVVVSFGMFAARLVRSATVDEWAWFYPRYVRLARWHRRAAP